MKIKKLIDKLDKSEIPILSDKELAKKAYQEAINRHDKFKHLLHSRLEYSQGFIDGYTLLKEEIKQRR